MLKQVGQPRAFNFEPKQHFELGEALGMMDFATAAKLAGARFTVLRGPLARMERALGQFMLDQHTLERGYLETIVPSLVNAATAYGTGSLPKFEEDLFKTTDGRYLIPTAEVPLTNTVAGDIVAEKQLPMRLTALTDCYPQRGRIGRAGHPRHAAPASVPQGRTGLHRPSRQQRGGARVDDPLRRDDPGEARAALPADAAVVRRYRVSPRPARMTWRSGCRASRCTGKSPPARTAGISRRAG